MSDNERFGNWQQRIAFLLTFFIFIIVIVVGIQVQLVNDSARKAQRSSNEVKMQVQQVIEEQLNSPQARQNTQESRQRIVNMEYKLCGGPCPAAPTTAPNTPTIRNQ